MSFSSRIVEARLALKLIKPEEFPSIAMDALEAGLDGPVIRRLAGLIQPSGYETDLYVERFMAEAGFQKIPVEVAAVRLAQHLAREVIGKNLSPLRAVRELEYLWITAGYPGPQQYLGNLDDEINVYGLSSLEAAEMVRDSLKSFAELPDFP
jgi:hypothetical protein